MARPPALPSEQGRTPDGASSSALREAGKDEYRRLDEASGSVAPAGSPCAAMPACSPFFSRVLFTVRTFKLRLRLA